MKATQTKPPRKPLGQGNAAQRDVTRQRITGTQPLDVAAFQSYVGANDE